MKKCQKCGAENPDGADFCSLCMERFDAEELQKPEQETSSAGRSDSQQAPAKFSTRREIVMKKFVLGLRYGISLLVVLVGYWSTGPSSKIDWALFLYFVLSCVAIFGGILASWGRTRRGWLYGASVAIVVTAFFVVLTLLFMPYELSSSGRNYILAHFLVSVAFCTGGGWLGQKLSKERNPRRVFLPIMIGLCAPLVLIPFLIPFSFLISGIVAILGSGIPHGSGSFPAFSTMLLLLLLPFLVYGFVSSILFSRKMGGKGWLNGVLVSFGMSVSSFLALFMFHAAITTGNEPVLPPFGETVYSFFNDLLAPVLVPGLLCIILLVLTCALGGRVGQRMSQRKLESSAE